MTKRFKLNNDGEIVDATVEEQNVLINTNYVRTKIVELCGDLSRIELFARQKREILEKTIPGSVVFQELFPRRTSDEVNLKLWKENPTLENYSKIKWVDPFIKVPCNCKSHHKGEHFIVNPDYRNAIYEEINYLVKEI